MKLKWTKRKPSKPGWYWEYIPKYGVLENPRQFLVVCRKIHAIGLFKQTTPVSKLRKDMLYYGPITPPPLPKEKAK